MLRAIGIRLEPSTIHPAPPSIAGIISSSMAAAWLSGAAVATSQGMPPPHTPPPFHADTQVSHPAVTMLSMPARLAFAIMPYVPQPGGGLLVRS